MKPFRLPAACVVASLAALVGLAAPAPAAVVEAQDDACAVGPPSCVAELKVSGGDGERNDLMLTPDGDAIVVADAGAPLVVIRGCERREDGTVRCRLGKPITQVVVQTGTEDDVVRAPLPAVDLVTAGLGTGNDRFEGDGKEVWGQGDEGADVLVNLGSGASDLEGRAGDDTLTGGAGADDLQGGPGRDALAGGAGDDELQGVDFDEPGPLDVERPEADVLDGGAGADRVTYAQRRIDVSVDLADPAPDGAPGEGDVLRDVENVQGGIGADRLSGDGGANVLAGENGPDTISGRGGDDDLRGGYHGDFRRPQSRRADVVDGGPGDDRVAVAGRGLLTGGPGDDALATGRLRPSSSSADCGPGADVVRVSRGTTPGVDGSCERWAVKLLLVRGRLTRHAMSVPTLRGGVARLTIPCSPVLGRRCIMTLDIRDGARLLARDREVVRPGRRARLSARVRGRLPGTVTVLVEVRRRRVSRIRGGIVVRTRG
ncbi:MAG TPA: calcium-binding protein [Solirubrobacteraceae bacterium]